MMPVVSKGNQGYALLTEQKIDPARECFAEANFWGNNYDAYDAHDFGFAAMMRLDAATADPGKADAWRTAAADRKRLASDEITQIDDALTAQRMREGVQWNADRLYQFDHNMGDLKSKQARPDWRPGRDFLNDPNYPGNDFTGPGRYPSRSP